MTNDFQEKRPQLGFWHVVSQDVAASASALLGVTMLITAGVMLPKSGAGVATSCVAVAALLAGVMAWRVRGVRSRVARAARVRARLLSNRVLPTAHNQSLRYLRFSYEFEGQALEAQLASATNGPHAGAQPGDELWILVDPQQPKQTWLLEQFVS